MRDEELEKWIEYRLNLVRTLLLICSILLVLSPSISPTFLDSPMTSLFVLTCYFCVLYYLIVLLNFQTLHPAIFSSVAAALSLFFSAAMAIFLVVPSTLTPQLKAIVVFIYWISLSITLYVVLGKRVKRDILRKFSQRGKK